MFGNYVYEKSSAQYEDKILLIDDESLEETTNYSADFLTHGFEVVRYKDDLSFRLEYEEKVKDGEDKIVVIAKSDSYVPYDMWRRLRGYGLSLNKLFPKLNSEALKGMSKVDLDLICSAYTEVFDDLRQRQQTDLFLRTKVYSRENLLTMVWGQDYPGDVRTVDVHVRRLREKIETNPSEPKYVHTKWGVGYYYNQK